MALLNERLWHVSDADLEFLIRTASPGATDIWGLKRMLREDAAVRTAFLQDDRVIKRVMEDEQVLLRISPKLYFEILLRQAARDLKQVSYTLETTSTMRIPVFDSHELADLLEQERVLLYLADMLASFTRVTSYTLAIRVREGLWRKIRFNDLDLSSLIQLCEFADEEYQLGVYKRIGDICLFILGMFPEYAAHDYRYPFSGQLRPHLRGKVRISPEEYARQGRKFYQLAADHQAAQALELSGTFQDLHDHFLQAQKPLTFIADHYLAVKKHHFFG
ncbi:hypothetical protein GF339_03560 [candidate division KSB3 bacterium]|uniref:Uncharacterized protein n=1 Tax=candidate division KSB3 bacterium TaxID=2044937 RepID=A0A9D5JT57_9BACT|nr:hypothetical protein [candidate division KSB3 bacterium]MBD3323635.1 hypothetical protein [candidate division KSB3 bacterium]